MVRRKIDHEHGTNGRYRQGCRCQPCKTANADYSAQQREVYRATAAVDPGAIPKHGTLTSYAQWGCRCESCVTTAREYDRERRRKARAAKQAAERQFSFTPYNLPAEVVRILDEDAGKVHRIGGSVTESLARILNAYEQWRYEQINMKEDQVPDGYEDAHPDAV